MPPASLKSNGKSEFVVSGLLMMSTVSALENLEAGAVGSNIAEQATLEC